MIVAVYGDIHLSDNNYGIHYNYPNETLEVYNKILDICKNNKADVVIGAGDFSFKRFVKLEYRYEVEKILKQFYELTNGRHYMIKGNHDIATYGDTEREFYIKKGLLKETDNIKDKMVSIRMFNYDTLQEAEANDDNSTINIDIIHDAVDSENRHINIFNKLLIIEKLKVFDNTKYILAGHIHKNIAFSENDRIVAYIGCATRPAYDRNELDNEGQVFLINTETGEVGVEKFELKPENEIFNMELIESRDKKKEDNERKELISSVIKSASEKSEIVNIGDIEEKINSMETVSSKYRKKAVELVRKARQ